MGAREGRAAVELELRENAGPGGGGEKWWGSESILQIG